MIGKYSPTIRNSYYIDQNWHKKIADADGYDPDGYDAYGYDRHGKDRAGHEEHEYAVEEDDHGQILYDRIILSFCTQYFGVE